MRPTRAVHFQEYWVRLHAAAGRARRRAVGVEDAKPGPGVLEAIATADVVLLPPSNPVVSIGTILAVPGIEARCARRPRRSSACRRSSAAHRCAAWPTRCSPRSASRRPRRRWPCTTAPDAARRLAGRRARRRLRCRRRGRRHRLPRRPAADVRPAGDRSDGARRRSTLAADRVGAVTRARTDCGLAVDGIPEVVRRRRPGRAHRCVTATVRQVARRTATSWSSPRRWSQGRGPGRCAMDREDAIAAETVPGGREPRRTADRRRPGTGFVLASAGVDASNTAARHRPAAAAWTRTRPPARCGPGCSSALGVDVRGGGHRHLRAAVARRAWSTWRSASAGLAPLDDLRGRVDPHGNASDMTVTAVADEIASAAELVKGKLGRSPVAVVRGLAHLVTGERRTRARPCSSGRPRRTCSGWGRTTSVPARRTVRAFTDEAGRPRRRSTCRGRRARRHPPRTTRRRGGSCSSSRPTARGAAGRDARGLGRGPARGRFHRRAGGEADCVAATCCARAPYLVVPCLVADGAHDYPDARRSRGGAGDVPRRDGRRRREPAGRAGRRGAGLGVGRQHDVLPRRRAARARPAGRLGADGRGRGGASGGRPAVRPPRDIDDFTVVL